jgi:hypothetical protein
LYDVPIGLLILGIKSTRSIPFFILTSLRFFEQKYKPVSPIIQRVSVVLTIALLLLTSYIFLYHAPVQEFPTRSVEYFNWRACHGNIFNSYNYGGYLIANLKTDKVYIDGRMPSWKHNGIDYFENYKRVFVDPEFRKAEFEKHDIKCVIVNTSEAKEMIANLLQEGWLSLTESESSVTLVKS